MKDNRSVFISPDTHTHKGAADDMEGRLEGGVWGESAEKEMLPLRQLEENIDGRFMPVWWICNGTVASSWLAQRSKKANKG